MLVGTTEMYLTANGHGDVGAEIEKLEADLKYQQDFIHAIEKKLSNEQFLVNAPEKVVAMERKKHADALARISSIESQLQNLRKK